MTSVCKNCGDTFSLTADEIAMWEEGAADIPKLCDDCFELMENKDLGPDEFSDADNGL